MNRQDCLKKIVFIFNEFSTGNRDPQLFPLQLHSESI